MKTKRHTAAWSRQQRKLAAKRDGGPKPRAISVPASMDMPVLEVAEREVDVDGQTLETWLDRHATEAPVTPEATSSEILAQNRQDMAANQEPKLQREATTKMGLGRQTSRILRDRPSHRPKPESDS